MNAQEIQIHILTPKTLRFRHEIKTPSYLFYFMGAFLQFISAFIHLLYIYYNYSALSVMHAGVPFF